MVGADADIWNTGRVTQSDSQPDVRADAAPDADAPQTPDPAVRAIAGQPRGEQDGADGGVPTGAPADTPAAGAPELPESRQPAEPSKRPAGDDLAAPPAVPRARWRPVLLVAIALAVLALDAVTKVLVVANIAPGENVRILGGLAYLTQIRNAGAAFNMATGMTWLLAIIALAVVAFIIRMAPKLRSTPWAVCLGLILGGALGNLSDRIFRAPGIMQGHVVDFVSLFGPNAEYFPAFNAADSAITIGGVLLVLLALAGFDFDGTRHRGRRRADRG